MRAVRHTTAGIEVLDLPPPDPASGTRVRIASASICGTDLNMMQWGPMPVTLGHELAGRLDDGTPVGIEPLAPCGECDQCLAEAYHRCRTGLSTFIGTGCDGGMADEIRLPDRALVPLPPGLDVADACLIEPVAVGVHGLRLAGAKAGMRVAVVGGGSIGLLAAAAAKAVGCAVDIVARHPVQLAAAAALGFGSVAGEYDVAVEAAGTDSAMATAADLAGQGATLLVLGVHAPIIAVPGITALLKELNVLSTITYNAHDGRRDVDDAATVLAAEPAIARQVITHRFPLERAADAFRVAADRSSGAIKVVLEP